jgi:hypothetical protein
LSRRVSGFTSVQGVVNGIDDAAVIVIAGAGVLDPLGLLAVELLFATDIRIGHSLSLLS